MNKRILWVGCFSPQFHSIGDHAQILAVQKFLADNFSDFEVIRFLRTELDAFFKFDVSKEDLIFIHSSGDFGDLHSDWHTMRKRLISSYPENKIIQLPVSVFYSNPNNFEKDKIYFSDKKNLMILCRHKKDALTLKQNFGCVVNWFPDFTFYLKPVKCSFTRRGLLAVFRQDGESAIKPYTPFFVRYKPFKYFNRRPFRRLLSVVLKVLDVFITANFYGKIKRAYPNAVIEDIQVSDEDITDSNRERIINDRFIFIQQFKKVVTDRFHARVFSYLTNTPCETVKGKIINKTENTFQDYRIEFRNFRNMVLNFNCNQEHLEYETPYGNIQDIIEKRRSIRKWIDKQVSHKKINLILRAGYYAPSAGNTQAVKLFPITDKKSLKFLCKNTSIWFNNNSPAFAVLVCYDLDKATQCNLDLKGWHKKFILQDTSAATMNIILSAEGLGLKSCWVSFNPNQEKRLMHHFGLSGLALTNGVFIGYSSQKISLSAMHQNRKLRRQV